VECLSRRFPRGQTGSLHARLRFEHQAELVARWEMDLLLRLGDQRPPDLEKPVAGGAEIQPTKNGGFNQMESADGAYVYYLKWGARALWRVSTGGGQESEILALTHETEFALGTHGAYFIETVAPLTLNYLDFATGATKVLGLLPGPVYSYTRLTVSPDEHWLVYGKSELEGSQLMLVEKFR
jgi:hypothetical protein